MKAQSINSHTCILWDVITRGAQSVCSHLQIIQDQLIQKYSLFIKKKWNCLIIFPIATLDVHIDEDRKTYFFSNHRSYQPDFSTTGMRWISFTTYNFCEFVLPHKNTKIGCSELFDVLQYILYYGPYVPYYDHA